MASRGNDRFVCKVLCCERAAGPTVPYAKEQFRTIPLVTNTSLVLLVGLEVPDVLDLLVLRLLD